MEVREISNNFNKTRQLQTRRNFYSDVFVVLFLKLHKNSFQTGLRQRSWKSCAGLSKAIQLGHIDLAKSIIQLVASREINLNYTSALQCAMKTGQAELVKLLLERIGPENFTIPMFQSLKDAAIHKHESVLKTFVELGITLDRRYFDQQSVLQMALNQDASDILKMLLCVDLGIDKGFVLHCAIENLKFQSVKELINSGVDANSRNSAGESALFSALKWLRSDNRAKKDNRFLGIIEILIKNGADINQKNKTGEAAVHLATKFMHSILLKMLLNFGADPNTQNDKGNTALHIVCENFGWDLGDSLSMAKVVHMLFESGASVHILNNRKQPALIYAITNCKFDSQYNIQFRPELVRLLIFHGADVSAQDISGKTALHYIVENLKKCGTGSEFICWMIQIELSLFKMVMDSSPDINLADSKSCTALHTVAELFDSFGLEDTLIKARASIDAKNNLNETPLHVAAQSKNVQMIVNLIRAGASLELPDSRGQFAKALVLKNIGALLHMERVDVLGALLESGIDVDWKDESGQTLLHTAAYFQNYDALKKLLQAGINVNVQDRSGRTAAHIICGRGQVNEGEMCRPSPYSLVVEQDAELLVEMLRFGADPELRTVMGNTVLHTLCEGSVTYESTEFEVQMLQHLLMNGADVDSQTQRGSTALHLAARRNDRQLLQSLILARGNLEIRDVDGSSPLLVAVGGDENSRKVEAVKMLVEAHSNVNAKDCQGRTVLHKAASFVQFQAQNVDLCQQKLTVLNCLIQAGAKVNEADDAQRTPLHIVASFRFVEALKLFIENGGDANRQDAKGLTPIHIYLDKIRTCESRSPKQPSSKDEDSIVIDIIEAYTDPSITCKNGVTLFYLAVISKKPNILQALVKSASSSINLKAGKDTTILHLAVRMNQVEMLTVLLQTEIDPNTRDNEGMTALHVATLEKNVHCVRVILDCPTSNINAVNLAGQTPFHVLFGNSPKTCKRQINEITRLFLSRGANVNVLDKKGHTVLHRARASFVQEAIDLLLQAGAYPNESKEQIQK